MCHDEAKLARSGPGDARARRDGPTADVANAVATTYLRVELTNAVILSTPVSWTNGGADARISLS